MDQGRSMRAACWPSRGGLYLLSGFLANFQVTDLSAIANTPGPTCAIISGKGWDGVDQRIAPQTYWKIKVTESGRTLESE